MFVNPTAEEPPVEIGTFERLVSVMPLRTNVLVDDDNVVGIVIPDDASIVLASVAPVFMIRLLVPVPTPACGYVLTLR